MRGTIAALAGSDACAKIRCGGVRSEMIPDAEVIARFIDLCAHADVPFKATAGLHHPLRGEYPLTYDPEPPRAMMHGFLSVFLASALRRQSPDFDATHLARLIREGDADTLAFDDGGARWKEHEIGTEGIAHARGGFCLAFGSCSFEEPTSELRELGLI